jgi:ubiquinone/menaquinone biosynthesis C-methylase UbiE
MKDIRDYVKEQYGKAIKSGSSCCGSGCCCCGTNGEDPFGITCGNYDQGTLENTPGETSGQSFGCGNPLIEANISLGETVLDLGSGAGLDLFLASEMVGPKGKVIGLDMTDEMLATAESNLKGIENVSLVKGYIEEMPIESESIDVIISNCVINLSPHKERVFKEAFRVLRPGGRLCVSDTVFTRSVPKWFVENLAAWSGCLSGGLQETEYETKLREAGFHEVEVRRKKVYSISESAASSAFPGISEERRSEIDGALASAIILGKKPLYKE